MLHRLALALAAATLTTASIAQACSCIGFASQAEADRAGERVYGAADLIVDATVGDASDRYKAICTRAGRNPDPTTIGQKVSGDRPFAIHRVLKGRAPVAPMLAGRDGEVFAQGCGVMSNSCDVGIASNARTVLVLRKVGARRYAMDGYCSLVAFRNSTRGKALFKLAG